MTVNTIPIAQLAQFGASSRSSAVWWSQHDHLVIGLYATLDNPIPNPRRHAIVQLVACRPHLCLDPEAWRISQPGACVCSRPCTRLLVDMIGGNVVTLWERGHVGLPGDALLRELGDRWALKEMGWTAREAVA